jgi:transforming growth factor-beta-induced protein
MKIKGLFGTFLLVAVAGLLGCTSPKDESSDAQPEDGSSERASSDSSSENSSTKAKPAGEQPQDIVDTAIAAGDFSTLAAALQAGELIETLKSEGPFTVFAPTDAAFAKLPEGTVEDLLKPENKDRLVAILTYHVVAGKVDSTAVSSLKTAKTVNGAEIAIDASSGVVKINDATVTTADIACSNGIIHVIDSVILPPTENSETPPHAGEGLTIEGVGSFKTLFAAIEAAGLKETLEKDGPFTVFAPTDEAFAALPAGTVENLLKPENKKQLVSILTYHVIAGEVPSSKVVELTSAKTVNGADVTIEVADGAVRVNDATVLKTDVPCEVGLIHAIDKVLMP